MDDKRWQELLEYTGDYGKAFQYRDEGRDLKDVDKVVDEGTLTGSWTVERGFMSVKGGAEALQRLYDDPKLRLQFGVTGREKVLREYDWSVVLPLWERFLEGLA